MPQSNSLHRHTPNLSVVEGRYLPLRQVGYHRVEAQQPIESRIQLTHVDASGQWHGRWDARLFQRLEQDKNTPCNQQVLASLSGRTVLNKCQDAGWQLALHGEAGQTVERWDTRGNHWQTEHDELLRPLLVRENGARVAERFTYSGTSDLNQRGRLVRHDDDAGSRLIDRYSLTGQEQGETRHFLASPDLPDWPDAPLEPGNGASTRFSYSPLGELLERTDALGNRERSRFNLSGELAGSRLILADGTERLLLTDTRYNAFGQIELQTAGNGVISHAEYDPADGRLRRMSSHRPGRSRLQDLHYAYDPVGNVIRIEDHSQPVRHFANQRIDPVSTFTYDSLYQLTEATGREAAGATIGPALPDLTPDPGDTSRLLNYRQLYAYDASGNLLSLQHIGQQPYTRVMSVAEHSNHAVPEPGNPLTSFDANGNLRQLSAGQPLQWNARNQLHSTRQVIRDEGESDEEHYRYGGDGLRVRKVVTRLVSGRMQSSEVRYLPGLELHTRQGESFAVITTQAGRCAVRCLVWSAGQPGGIANPQLRYSLDDLHDSSGLELDGEANIISHEGYYPFGGTAWWAANSAIEASYKTRRYSGQERDGTGLYDYGLRYYAPWLMRWINPDPAGDIDGLNRYRFVRNNPLTLFDVHGLNPDDRYYNIMNFSKGPKALESETMMASLGHPGIALNVDGHVTDFVYNTLWSTRAYLDRGMANQIGTVMHGLGASFAYGNLMRMRLSAGTDSLAMVVHALAARTGMCDEFSRLGVMLMSSSKDWPGTPIFLARNQHHGFGLVNDPRISDPLVVDSWVTFPAVHHLSQSLNAAGMRQPVDYTPRMPGDPWYAISRSEVEFLRETLYWEPYSPTAEDYSAVVERGLNRSVFWSQMSAMKEPQSVSYQHEGIAYNAASVPLALWPQAKGALDNSYRIEQIPGISQRLRRF